MNIAELKKNAYVPYSGQPRAAIVQSSQDKWFAGVRIENISFPLTISAVQNALFCCLSEGQTPAKLYVDDNQIDNGILQFWKKEFNLEFQSSEGLDSVSFHTINQPLIDDQISATLNELLNHTLAEYSGFPVSALLETSKGYISGKNIEVSSWGEGLCAERVALAKALSYGINTFKALHICTKDGEYNSPCGACRQVIYEHLPHQPVYLYHADGTTARHFSSDLLPYSFQSSSLKKP